MGLDALPNNPHVCLPPPPPPLHLCLLTSWLDLLCTFFRCTGSRRTLLVATCRRSSLLRGRGWLGCTASSTLLGWFFAWSSRPCKGCSWSSGLLPRRGRGAPRHSCTMGVCWRWWWSVFGPSPPLAFPFGWPFFCPLRGLFSRCPGIHLWTAVLRWGWLWCRWCSLAWIAQSWPFHKLPKIFSEVAKINPKSCRKVANFSEKLPKSC